MGLGKPGRLRVDQPTITVELGPAPDAYSAARMAISRRSTRWLTEAFSATRNVGK
jgi:hypothetical protein